MVSLWVSLASPRLLSGLSRRPLGSCLGPLCPRVWLPGYSKATPSEMSARGEATGAADSFPIVSLRLYWNDLRCLSNALRTASEWTAAQYSLARLEHCLGMDN